MTDLVCQREKTLGAVTLGLGLTAWFVLIFGTLGLGLLALGVAFLVYLFAHSTLIAYIKGNGVELEQFPELEAHFSACCERLQIKPRPQAYILNGNGGINAFATRFLGTEFVVLLSDVVDAMEGHPDGIRFYLGHELGHLKMKHLTGQLLRWPVLWLPLIGAAYARARETTCDRYGLACSSTPENAARALAALSTGGTLWKQLDLAAYVRQARDTDSFWMSFHELTAGYPWLTKRAARVLDPHAQLPARSRLAYGFAAFVPYSGRMGTGFSFLLMVYILGVLAAVGIPAVATYVKRSHAETTVTAVQPTLAALTKFYADNQHGPDSLKDIGASPMLSTGEKIAFDPDPMTITVTTELGAILFTPALDTDRKVSWTCSSSGQMKQEWLPDSCRAAAAAP